MHLPTHRGIGAWGFGFDKTLLPLRGKSGNGEILHTTQDLYNMLGHLYFVVYKSKYIMFSWRSEWMKTLNRSSPADVRVADEVAITPVSHKSRV
jgi:hypothetical protein